MMNFHEMRCPFESICRHRDAYTDRSEGCATQKFIVDKAMTLELSNQRKPKIYLVKQLREETGANLKTCVDALEYSGGDMIKARDYIKYGW